MVLGNRVPEGRGPAGEVINFTRLKHVPLRPSELSGGKAGRAHFGASSQRSSAPRDSCAPTCSQRPPGAATPTCAGTDPADRAPGRRPRGGLLRRGQRTGGPTLYLH